MTVDGSARLTTAPEGEQTFRCRRCGMVRASVVAPWCRHGDVTLPANRMERLPSHYPFADAKSTDPGMDWLAGA